MKQLARTCAGVVTGVLLSAASASAQVQNGGFENPPVPAPANLFSTYFAGQDFGHWTVAFGSIDLINGYWEAAEGTYSVDLDGQDPGGIYQDLVTTPGQTYSLNFFLSGNPGDAPIKSLSVFWNGILAGTFTYDVTGNTLSSMNWRSEDLDGLLATGSTTRLEFVSNDNAGSVAGPALDGLSLAPEVVGTPEPATIALVIPGLAALLIARRRVRGASKS